MPIGTTYNKILARYTKKAFSFPIVAFLPLRKEIIVIHEQRICFNLFILCFVLLG